jgi:O-antigen chain-terminating methyltransferase
MDNNFYISFEGKFRGSRNLIKKRLSNYIPILEQLIIGYPNSLAVDLGCGRGEWLEILKELGFKAKGIDIDELMINDCRMFGLEVELQDAIKYLKSMPNESLTVVSGFHMVEHIKFEEVQQLFEETFRVLKPGGILILETPNPENITVATSSFYIDPYHQRVIPSQLLTFLSQYYGFAKEITFGLNESIDLSNKQNITLLNVLRDVSPDYVVISQKDGGPECLKSICEISKIIIGPTIISLSDKFEDRIKNTENELLEWRNFKISPIGKFLNWLNNFYNKLLINLK